MERQVSNEQLLHGILGIEEEQITLDEIENNIVKHKLACWTL